jgi:CheY-like chemotaxis protein
MEFIMATLEGLRVLLVEDDVLIAMMLEGVLLRVGCVVVGPFCRVEKAAQAARDAAIDVAVLDVNLAGERVYPVAEALAHRGVPFVFMTGYNRSELPAEYSARPALAKPFMARELTESLAAVRNPVAVHQN